MSAPAALRLKDLSADLGVIVVGYALGWVLTGVGMILADNLKIKRTVREVEDELQQRVAEDDLHRAATEQHGGGDGSDGADSPPAVA